MELIQLKYFKTVAETGKISAASKVLFVSSPALSTSISRLEKELGYPLFVRENNRLHLNSSGQIFLKYTNRIFSELEFAKAELRRNALQKERYVSIATVSSIQWVDMIAALSAEKPEYTLQCAALSRRELTVAGLSQEHSFLLAAADDIPVFYRDKLESLPLFEDYPVVMIPREHPLAKKELVELEDLAEETLYLPMQDFPLYDRLVDLYEKSALPFPAGNAYSHLATTQMVASGLGLSFATKHTAQNTTLPVVCRPLGGHGRPWVSSLYWRKSRKLTPDERAFMAFVKSYYREQEKP